MRAAVAVTLASFVAAGSAKSDCSGRILEGPFEPIGSAFWNVTVDFDRGEAVHSKPDGARAVRRVGTHACSSNRITFTLVSGTPEGVPDLECRGATTGNDVQGRCFASGGNPELRFTATLRNARQRRGSLDGCLPAPGIPRTSICDATAATHAVAAHGFAPHADPAAPNCDTMALLQCAKGGHVCAVLMEGRPLHGATFGVVGAVTPLVDLWVEEGRSPACVRAAPFSSGKFMKSSIPDRA